MIRRFCPEVGCRALVVSGRCDKHKRSSPKQVAKPVEDQTAWERESKEFLNSKVWKDLSQWKLAKDPVCEYCEGNKRPPELATQCDHMKPRKQFPELALDADNLRSACDYCHAKKTRWEKKVYG